MSNEDLGEILDILPNHVSELLTDLESKGYVEIKNRMSRYRRIYFRPNPKVGDILLSTNSESGGVLLSTNSESTLDEFRTITKKKLKKQQKRAHKTKDPVCENPPTEQDVRAYSETQGVSDFDAKRFVEWYTAAEWRHKDGEPVLNWKQTVLSWIRRDKVKEAAKPEPKRGDPDWYPDEAEIEEAMKG